MREWVSLKVVGVNQRKGLKMQVDPPPETAAPPQQNGELYGMTEVKDRVGI